MTTESQVLTFLYWMMVSEVSLNVDTMYTPYYPVHCPVMLACVLKTCLNPERYGDFV